LHIRDRGKKLAFYLQITWDRDESKTVNERGKRGRNQMGKISLETVIKP